MKIVVFDDDPTGSQTVYGCPLILNCEQNMLEKAIRDPSDLIFLLTNTRSMSPSKAELTTRNICRAFKYSSANQGLNFRDVLFVSRGDSTLRGHGVLEPEVINQELGPFDATFHVPAFLEGGRITRNGVHLLNNSPVHLTDFALDQMFGYSTSFLPDWLEEKSNGRISANSVFLLRSQQLTSAINSKRGMENLYAFLQGLSNNALVVVDAEVFSQLAIFAKLIIKLMGHKRFLFRSAASLVSAFAQLPVNTYTPSSLASLRLRDKFSRLKQGLIIVGSHVKLADQQLEVLLNNSSCEGIELHVEKIARVLDGILQSICLDDLENQYFLQLQKVLSCGKTPVLFTSRGEISFSSSSRRMLFGLQLAELMARLVKKLLPDLGYVISKGGITTQILLQKGLDAGIVQLKGQILPGLSLVCPRTDDAFRKIPIITFPGNLGDNQTLLKAWSLMEEVD